MEDQGMLIKTEHTIEERLTRLEELVIAMKSAIEKLPALEEEQNRNRTALLALYEGTIEAAFKVGLLRGKDGEQSDSK